MALKGIKVIEMLGLAPGPFCGTLLADFGASVMIVDKIKPQMFQVMGNGKKNVALNLKSEQGQQIFREICKNSDVLIEPFRPGVMEKMNLGPNVLLSDNPRLIYARLTGYGQYGDYSKKAGHDINYVSLSGLLSMLGGKKSSPLPPINFAADFAGGGVLCAFGIVMALYERTLSNKGQVLDASMVDGTAYISSWIFRSQNLPIWGNSRGENLLDGGAPFYNTYKTKDNKFITVGALEPQFYDDLLRGLGLPIENKQYDNFAEQEAKFAQLFLTRTQKEWIEAFEEYDACITPVLSLEEASKHPHNVARNTFVQSFENNIAPSPAPRLSRTPAVSVATHRPAHHGEHTQQILRDHRFSNEDIKKWHDEGVIYIHSKSNL